MWNGRICELVGLGEHELRHACGERELASRGDIYSYGRHTHACTTEQSNRDSPIETDQSNLTLLVSIGLYKSTHINTYIDTHVHGHELVVDGDDVFSRGVHEGARGGMQHQHLCVSMSECVCVRECV